MENKNYHRTITVNASAAEAMGKINQINQWWKHDFSGSAEKLNDRFKIPFGELNGNDGNCGSSKTTPPPDDGGRVSNFSF